MARTGGVRKRRLVRPHGARRCAFCSANTEHFFEFWLCTAILLFMFIHFNSVEQRGEREALLVALRCRGLLFVFLQS